MNKTLLLLLLSACLLPAVSTPVRDAAAAKSLSFIEDSAPRNYWVWPDSLIDTQKASPSTVWNPVVGVWYNYVSENGYILVRDAVLGSFTSPPDTMSLGAI